MDTPIPVYGFLLHWFLRDHIGSYSASASLTVTVTATWVPDPNLPTDPSPPSVWLCESGRSEWSCGGANASGSAVDGLGSEYTPGPGPFTFGTGVGGVADSATATASVPPAYWHKYSVSGGTVTLPTRTLTANSNSSGYSYYGDNLSAWIDDYTVSVHAQPYNFYRAPGQSHIYSDGSLVFVYDWLSASGNKNDLTSCYWHEYVTYPGPVSTIAAPNRYYPPKPPFDSESDVH